MLSLFCEAGKGSMTGPALTILHGFMKLAEPSFRPETFQVVFEDGYSYGSPNCKDWSCQGDERQRDWVKHFC